MLYNTLQHFTILYNTTQHYKSIYNSTQHCRSLYNTTQHYTSLYNTTQHYTSQYNTSPLYTTECFTSLQGIICWDTLQQSFYCTTNKLKGFHIRYTTTNTTPKTSNTSSNTTSNTTPNTTPNTSPNTTRNTYITKPYYATVHPPTLQPIHSVLLPKGAQTGGSDCPPRAIKQHTLCMLLYLIDFKPKSDIYRVKTMVFRKYSGEAVPSNSSKSSFS